MVVPEDESFMRLAIDASARAFEQGDGPFGAALTRAGVLIQIGHNNQNSAGDLMGHAEVTLIREAVRLHGRSVCQGATVYASGEPCAMCCGAMFWAGVARVVYAATQADIIAALGGASLPVTSAQVLAGATPAVVIDGPLLREEAVKVLRRVRA
jgi:tRNA(adenine34) deaminase